MAALDGLMIRLRRARDMRDQSEVNMTVIAGQTRIIQMIAVTCVAVVAALPMFRGAYESTFGQFIFMGIATVGVATSWYIDKKSTELKEKVL
jgi:preprotein translocase subunit SecF